MPKKHYLKEVILYTGLFIALAAVGASSFYFGYQRGAASPRKVTVENLTNLEGKENLKTDFGVFWEAWDVLKKEHLKGEEAKDKDLVYGAIKGLVSSLGDPHTVFFPPEDSKKFEEDVSGNFGGIGAEIGIRSNQLVVIAPLKGNPAEKVGLKAGDKIVAIDGKGTEGVDVNEAVKKIRGEIGTEVTLTIFRDGWERTKDFKIMRANIEIPTLEWELIQKDSKELAHIKLFSFNQNAPAVFYKAALAVLLGKADGIILDLRNDPGGYLEVAVNLAGWFLNRGEVIVTEKFRQGDPIVFYANGNGALRNVPTVILVNKGSASASEILAGALRSQLGIKLVGEKTFGKGTVQELRPLSDNSKIKLTIANWVLPDGHIIDDQGLKPDVEVEIKEEDLEKAEKNKIKIDPQLDKAAEVLLEEIKQKLLVQS
ncbi:MAG: S41 family peptidase [Candidatus Harrisonbacteria bacterium]|nr:S41 family peptidase [Candidatus Harrisonbacteria bacterium]